MAAYTKLVEEDGSLTGLHAYHASRPPHSEGLAVTIASYLAHETDLATINLLHLSSAKAMDAAMRMAGAFPHVDFRREVTIGHLLADVDTANGAFGKVNPPIRPREDVEALWEHVLAGDVDWVVSTTPAARRSRRCRPSIPTTSGWPSRASAAPSTCSRACTARAPSAGLSPAAVARLVSTNPARRYGLTGKGSLEVGNDADIVLLDPDRSYVVHAEDSPSSQGYTPFEGHELTGQVRDVWLRGSRILEGGNVVGQPIGQYQSRGPTRSR